MQSSIFGAGYVGLGSSVRLADNGYKVMCADVDLVKSQNLKVCTLAILKPILQALALRNLNEGRLHITADIAHTGSHGPDKFIVKISTAPVGAPDKIQASISQALAENEVKILFDIVSNSELLKKVLPSTIS
jgi:UDPglucose 6-dehydrogenase